MTTFDASVAERLSSVRADIATACERAGRDPGEVTLVAVSKTQPVAAIRAALDADQLEFGENRVQEGLDKLAQLAGSAARIHLIGHLQRNKARFAGQFASVQSVDSIRLAAAIARNLEAPLDIMLEVNVAAEASKDGFAPDDVEAALSEISALPHLNVNGLMTIAPLVEDAEAVRPVFRRLREMRDALGLRELSMGMSNDYDVAIEEGATIVRIGRAIFGERADDRARDHAGERTA